MIGLGGMATSSRSVALWLPLPCEPHASHGMKLPIWYWKCCPLIGGHGKAAEQSARALGASATMAASIRTQAARPRSIRGPTNIALNLILILLWQWAPHRVTARRYTGLARAGERVR